MNCLSAFQYSFCNRPSSLDLQLLAPCTSPCDDVALQWRGGRRQTAPVRSALNGGRRASNWAVRLVVRTVPTPPPPVSSVEYRGICWAQVLQWNVGECQRSAATRSTTSEQHAKTLLEFLLCRVPHNIHCNIIILYDSSKIYWNKSVRQITKFERNGWEV